MFVPLLNPKPLQPRSTMLLLILKYTLLSPGVECVHLIVNLVKVQAPIAKHAME